MANTAFDRSIYKTNYGTLMVDLQKDYSLSPAEARLLSAALIDKFQKEYSDKGRHNGQIITYAVAEDEPAGKPLEQCRKIPVKLTLHDPEDLEIRKSGGLYSLRRHLVLRLAQEAYEQGALLTQEDIANLIFIDRSTVKRIIAEYKEQGIYVPTRGQVNDIGPGVSHKTKIIELFLKGYTFTEISIRMSHSHNSIKRYIEDFKRIVMLYKSGLKVHEIRLITKLTEKLIREYLSLYKDVSFEGSNKYLVQIIESIEHPVDTSKKGGLII